MTPQKRSSPTLAASAWRIFDLSLSQMLWSRRSVFLGLVVGGPIVLALGIRAIGHWSRIGLPMANGMPITGPTLFGMMIWLLYIRFVLPVLGVFYGTSLIADEVEDKTITYLFTRPISRSAVLLGKYMAYLVCTVLLVLPSVVIVYFLVVPLGGGSVGREFPALASDLGVLTLGLAAYGAVFAFVGARLKRPIVIGLVFAFGWEHGVQILPGYIKQATVVYYLQGLVPHAMPNDSVVGGLIQLFNQPPSKGVSIAVLVVLTGVMLWLAGRSVQKREFVLEQ
jgi:ABC-type transport system involved in multi-copper enzyme maturation permease subunit